MLPLPDLRLHIEAGATTTQRRVTLQACTPRGAGAAAHDAPARRAALQRMGALVLAAAARRTWPAAPRIVGRAGLAGRRLHPRHASNPTSALAARHFSCAETRRGW